MHLPQHLSISRERLNQENSKVQQLISGFNSSKVNLSAVKYPTSSHTMNVLEHRNIRNKTTDGFDEHATKLQDEREAQDRFVEAQQHIQIHDNNKDSYHLSHITAVRKDQVSL